MHSGQFHKAVIYYFTGTGNARFAAYEISKNLEMRGIECHVCNIADKGLEIERPDDNVLLGFCYPTHGFNAPPIVLKFLRFFLLMNIHSLFYKILKTMFFSFNLFNFFNI